MAGLVLALLASLTPVLEARAGAATTSDWSVPPPPESPAVDRSVEEPAGSWVEPPAGRLPQTDAVEFVERDPKFDPDSSVELLEARSADQQVWRNADGTTTLQSFGEPQFFQREGASAWLPIDSRVVADDTRQGWLRNAANRWTARFGPVGGDRPGGVELEADGHSVRVAPIDAANTAAVVGEGADADTVTYEGVWPGVDLRYTVTAVGVKEDIVVHDRSAPSSFAFDVSGAEFVADETMPGAMVSTATVERDGVAAPVFSVPPVELVDRKGRRLDSRAASARMAVDSVEHGQQLVVSVDDGWLLGLDADAFPVVIDPTLNTSSPSHVQSYAGVGGSQVSSCSGLSTCGIRVGADANYPFPMWTSTLGFNYVAALGAKTHSANLTLTCDWCSSSQWTDLQVGWASGASWAGASNPPAYTSTIVDILFDGDPVDIEVTSLVDAWTSGSYSGQLFGFWDSYSSSGPDTYKTFDGASLSVTYNNVPLVSSQSPANNTTSGNFMPTLSASLSDANGQAMSWAFKICETTNGTTCSGATSTVGSGSGAASPSTKNAAVPSGWLADGHSYLWWAEASDGTDTGVGAKRKYTVANSPPTVPSLSAPADESVVSKASPSLVLSGASTDPDGHAVQYEYQVTTSPDGQKSRVHDSGWISATTYQVPEGVLPDGAYWWTVRARDENGKMSAWSSPRKFESALYQGLRPDSPTDEMGPFAVNLLSGNAVVSYQGPSFPTVGEPVGVSLAYNSLSPLIRGLVGTYAADMDGDMVRDGGEDVVLSRLDPQVSFDWGTPGDGPLPDVIDPAHFTAEWRGWLTVPSTSNWVFVADVGSGNSTEVEIGGAGVVLSGTGTQASSSVSLTANTPLALTVKYGTRGGDTRLRLEVRLGSDPAGSEYPIPASWLSPSAPSLPDGWARSGDVLGAAAYTEVRPANGQTTAVIDRSGASHVFTNNGYGWQPPPHERGTLTQDEVDGSWTFTTGDREVYVFDSAGRLTGVTAVAATADPAALTYTYTVPYTGGPSRLTTVADATGREMELVYGTPVSEADPCPTAGGFTRAPAAMLCEAVYTDFGGDSTELYYSNGQLARIMDAGDSSTGRPTTDFWYDTAGRLVNLRDQRTNDLLAMSGSAPFTDPDNDTDHLHRWVLGYDSASRVVSVKAPKPSLAGTRAEHTYDYATATVTKVQVAGFTGATGYFRQIEHDGHGRILSDKGPTGVGVDYEWFDTTKRLKKIVDHRNVNDPTGGLVTTGVYDQSGRMTDTYGPGEPAEFNGFGVSATAPHQETNYDEDLGVLSGTWYDNPDLSGTPKLVSAFDGDEDWGAGAPSSASFPGVTLPTDGFSGVVTGEFSSTSTIEVTADAARVYIDDSLVSDTWDGAYPAASRGAMDYWRLGDTGAVAADRNGARPGTYHGTGTLHDTADALAGDANTAFAANAPDSRYVELPDDVVYGTNQLSVSAWFKTSASGPIVGYQAGAAATGNPTDAVPLIYVGTDGKLRGEISPTPAITTTGTVNNGAWHHVVLTHTGATQKLYLDGALVGSANGTIDWKSMHDIQIGLAYPGSRPAVPSSSSWWYFTGSIDEVAVWDRAMTSAAWLYSSAGVEQRTTYVSPGVGVGPYWSTTPWANWPLTDYDSPPATQGTAVADVAGDYQATAVGGVTWWDGTSPTGYIAAHFDGVDDHIELPDNVVARSTNLSIMGWFSTTGPGGILGTANAAATHYQPVLYVGTDGKLRGQFPTGTISPITSSISVDDGQWHHVALTGSGNIQTLYLDGKWVGSLDGTINHLDMTDNWLGKAKATSWPASSATWMYLPGALSNFAVYSEPISAATVQQAYIVPFQFAWTNGATHKLRIEYRDPGGDAHLKVATPFGGTLRPRYNLVTSTTDPDGRTTETGYDIPELGRPTSVTVDPSGLDLTTSTAYETPGAGKYFRRTSRTLPAGNTWTYQYYGTDTAMTADDPCTAGTQAIHQGGAQWKRTGPDPDGGGSEVELVEETVYDVQGRVRATRVGSGSWTCTTYDARGRVATVDYPAFGGKSARTVTYSYYVFGGSSPVASPLVSKISDSVGDITTETDWVGRTVSYTDVWGKTTTTAYDTAGRVTQTSGPAGTLASTYDTKNRLSALSLDSVTVATPSYDSGSGLMTGVSYGNSTTGAVSFDDRGRIDGLDWTGPSSTTITTDAVTRSLASNITDETIDGGGSPDNTYTYDDAGRLTEASIGTTDYTYSYAATGGCGTLTAAGKNTNRTSMVVVVNGGSPTTTDYCYDDADRLTSTTASGIGTLAYDGQGNTTSIAGETHTYDAANRHLDTTKSGTTVSYTRDALDRIVARTDGTTTTRYSFAGDGDSPVATLNTSNTVTERTIGLPLGTLLTKRAAGDVWSYPNIHGDVAAVANSSGAKQGSTYSYDPYGNPTATPDNSASDFDYGWVGQHQRPLEHNATLLPMVEMGARQYSPLLGRFLEIDPIEGGTKTNDYAYVADPISKFDLNGQMEADDIAEWAGMLSQILGIAATYLPILLAGIMLGFGWVVPGWFPLMFLAMNIGSTGAAFTQLIAGIAAGDKCAIANGLTGTLFGIGSTAVWGYALSGSYWDLPTSKEWQYYFAGGLVNGGRAFIGSMLEFSPHCG